METDTKRRVPWLAVIAIAAVMVVAGIVIGVLVTNNDDANTAYADQLTSIQHGCQQWTTDDPTGAAIDCSQMTEWMRGRMSANGMGPEMMFGDPDQMRATCVQWMTANPPTGITDPQAHCDAMVTWMNNHMGDWSGRGQWDDWMVNGPMMAS